MAFVSARTTRTAVFVIALSGAGLWALSAMDAKADPPSMDDASPCAEGRALFTAKLAYLEARIAPEPSQEEAWRHFADAMGISSGEADRACAEEPPRSLSVDTRERLERMEKHAAATQAMFGAMAKAYEAVAPSLTTEQREIVSRKLVPSAGGRDFPQPEGRGPHTRRMDVGANSGPSGEKSNRSAPPAL
jgi:periplasmic protein CpxP/Spy